MSSEQLKILEGARNELQKQLISSTCYEQYKKAPDITRQRLYIETMERILSESDKIILDAGQNSAHGIVPVLPLNDLMRQQLQHPPARDPKAATTCGGSQ